MKKPIYNIKLILTKVVIFVVTILILLIIYAYHSGSCKIDSKKYECDENFCLKKEFDIQLKPEVMLEINGMLKNKDIQKRVEIKSFAENIGNCAFPNKAGVTVPSINIEKTSPKVISFYQNELCNKISDLVGFKVYPTDLSYPTSCVLLIYEKEGDWINWHYDYNYYNGRFFTVLIPITHELTCTKFEYKDEKNKVVKVNLNKNAICFEGNYLYHRASKLCKNQKRVILSCQFVTDNDMSFINQLRIKLKDFAYIGKLF
jgi:hypothetical protein